MVFKKKSNNKLKCYSGINHCLFLLIDEKILIDIKTKTISTQNYLYVVQTWYKAQIIQENVFE